MRGCTDLFHMGKQLEEQGGPGGVVEAGGVGGEDAEADALLLEGLGHTQGEGCHLTALHVMRDLGGRDLGERGGRRVEQEVGGGNTWYLWRHPMGSDNLWLLTGPYV